MGFCEHSTKSILERERGREGEREGERERESTIRRTSVANGGRDRHETWAEILNVSRRKRAHERADSVKRRRSRSNQQALIPYLSETIVILIK